MHGEEWVEPIIADNGVEHGLHHQFEMFPQYAGRIGVRRAFAAHLEDELNEVHLVDHGTTGDGVVHYLGDTGLTDRVLPLATPNLFDDNLLAADEIEHRYRR